MDNVIEISAKNNIQDLVHRYAFNIRRGKGTQCAELFTSNGVFTIREAKNSSAVHDATIRKSLEGREAIYNYLSAASMSGVVVCPIIHNLLIEIDGNRATSSCLMTTRTWPSEHALVGEYYDTFQLGDCGWRFETRTYTIYTG